MISFTFNKSNSRLTLKSTYHEIHHFKVTIHWGFFYLLLFTELFHQNLTLGNIIEMSSSSFRITKLVRNLKGHSIFQIVEAI